MKSPHRLHCERVSQLWPIHFCAGLHINTVRASSCRVGYANGLRCKHFEKIWVSAGCECVDVWGEQNRQINTEFHRLYLRET